MEKLIPRNKQYGGYYYNAIVSNGNISAPILIEANNKGTYAISVGIIPETGSGKIQYTLDPENQVIADTADWFDWDKGEVTEGTVGSFVSAISAVRCVSISGNVKFKILI